MTLKPRELCVTLQRAAVEACMHALSQGVLQYMGAP